MLIKGACLANQIVNSNWWVWVLRLWNLHQTNHPKSKVNQYYQGTAR